MKQQIKSLTDQMTYVAAVIVAVLGMAFASMVLAPAANASADCDVRGGQNLSVTSGVNCAQGEDQPTELFGDAGIFTTIVNVLLFLIGAISVIMLIIGGVRYTISNGDQGAVTSAKNTILYAVIGLIVAILAYAIVGFITGQFATSN